MDRNMFQAITMKKTFDAENHDFLSELVSVFFHCIIV